MLSIIVAKSRNNVIGKNGDIPWHISEDLIRFRNITIGHPVIMGRSTYESILKKSKKDKGGLALEGRTNIVLTKTIKNSFLKTDNNLFFVDSKDKARQVAEKSIGSEEIFVIGGESIYKLFFSDVSKLYITEIEENIEGDKYFVDFNISDWVLESIEFRVVKFKSMYLKWKYVTYVKNNLHL